MNLLIMADDLSGAADSAIGFARSGFETVLTLDTESSLTYRDEAQVIVLDVDSRRLSPADAAVRNQRCWRSLSSDEASLYKKIDSTLRGNWAAEVAAMQVQAGMVILAPAFPATGRTTRQGRQYLYDIPLEHTDMWQREGVKGIASLPHILAAEGLCVELITLDVVRDRAALERGLFDCASARVPAVVCDAETEFDLQCVAEASAALPDRKFWVGSGGLARKLTNVINVSPPMKGVGPSLRCHSPVVIVVGSRSERSQQQARCARAEDGVTEVVVSPVLLTQKTANADWEACQSRIARALDKGDLLLRIETDRIINSNHILTKALAMLLRPYAEAFEALIATGGETARAIMDVMNIRALRLSTEIEPGVVVSEALGERRLTVITKAGSFGSENALVAAYRYLKNSPT